MWTPTPLCTRNDNKVVWYGGGLGLVRTAFTMITRKHQEVMVATVAVMAVASKDTRNIIIGLFLLLMYMAVATLMLTRRN